MDQRPTAQTTDMGDLIGALEIGSVPGIDDGVLEAAADMNARTPLSHSGAPGIPCF